MCKHSRGTPALFVWHRGGPHRAARKGMTRLTGELVVCANSPHVYQVITGFLMLQREGIVDVAPRFDRTYRPHLPSSHIAELRLREGVTVAYDMIDGYNFVGPAALDDYLSHVDVYF